VRKTNGEADWQGRAAKKNRSHAALVRSDNAVGEAYVFSLSAFVRHACRESANYPGLEWTAQPHQGCATIEMA
jgi:hypothetical protein